MRISPIFPHQHNHFIHTLKLALEKDMNWTIRDGFIIGLSFLKKGIILKTLKAHSHQHDALMGHAMLFLRVTEKIEP